MDEQPKATAAEDDWSLLEEATRLVAETGALDPGQWGGFLLRVGPMTYGITQKECESAVATAEGAARLVREVRHRITAGDQRLAEAIRRAPELCERGMRKAAQQLFRDILAEEPIALYRDVAAQQLDELMRMRVIAEREYGFVPSSSKPGEKVILRLGSPEQEEPPAWVLPFEIVGPAERHIAYSPSSGAADAVQALLWGLQLVAAELRSLEQSENGRLIFLGRKDIGFGLPDIP